MSAYFETGFSVRKPMWHRQGDVLDDYPTNWRDAREKAGLLWEPEERVAYQLRPESSFRNCLSCGVSLGGSHAAECIHDGDVFATSHCLPGGAYVTEAGIFEPVPDHKLIVRPDTDLVLGVTSAGFQAIYHGEDGASAAGEAVGEDRASMEQIIDAFTTADGKIRFETAGSLRQGRNVWALFWLDEPFTVPGDSTEHLPFIGLLNSHDGSGACKLIRTQVRIVCWNTWQMASADAERRGTEFTFRHVGDVRDRIEEAKAAIAGLRTETAEYLSMVDELTALNVDDAKVAAFLTEFLPSPRENGEVCSDRVHDNVEKARALFRHIYLDSVTTEGIRGTGFGLLQTSTEYLDHARAYRSPDSYLGRSILRAEPAKAKALQIVRSLG